MQVIITDSTHCVCNEGSRFPGFVADVNVAPRSKLHLPPGTLCVLRTWEKTRHPRSLWIGYTASRSGTTISFARNLAPDLFELSLQQLFSAQPINGPTFGRRHQPGTWILWHARLRPCSNAATRAS